jgi:DNA-binding NtrC family response regulator
MFEVREQTHASMGARDLKSLVAEFERRLILSALDRCGGHQRRAAAALGLLPSTLNEKMRRLGLRQTRQERWAIRPDMQAGLNVDAA